MRNIINLSLPKELTKLVKSEVKAGHYASVSEYFRYLLRTHELAKELEKSRREIEAGKGRILRSLRDLR